MKKLTLAVVLIASLAACASQPLPGSETPMWQPPYKIDGDRVTFNFVPSFYGRDEVTAVSIRGAFSGWKDSGLQFTQVGPDLWTLTVPLAEVAVPGNSGQPEYKFVANDDDWVSGVRQPEAYEFNGNFILMLPGDSLETLKQKKALNDLTRSEATDYANEAEMANFRTLAGGQLAPGRLYRSYHPWLTSKRVAVEKLRVQTAAALMEKNHIGAVLNLTDAPTAVERDSVPAYYKALAAKGQVLFAETSYEKAYFAPHSPEFGQTLQAIVGFVGSHSGPYLVHCRLGTDRTGVVTAVLEALAGVPWETIATDYQLSNRLGIQEYRDRDLLAYSFKMMLGQPPTQVANLQASMKKFLVESGVSEAAVAAAYVNLTKE